MCLQEADVLDKVGDVEGRHDDRPSPVTSASWVVILHGALAAHRRGCRGGRVGCQVEVEAFR
jgi:hypothetical protein